MNLNESEKILLELKDLCLKLGWSLAFNTKNDKIEGMLIGSEDFIKNIALNKEDFEKYDYYEPGTLQ